MNMVAKPTTSLALDSGAAEEASTIDALPYIDGITADDRHQAEELIKEEVCTQSEPILLASLRKSQLPDACAAAETKQ